MSFTNKFELTWRTALSYCMLVLPVMKQSTQITLICLDTGSELMAQGRIRGGGSRGSGPPFLAHDVGFLTLDPKLDPLLPPPLFFLLVDGPHFSKILDPPLWLVFFHDYYLYNVVLWVRDISYVPYV